MPIMMKLIIFSISNINTVIWHSQSSFSLFYFPQDFSFKDRAIFVYFFSSFLFNKLSLWKNTSHYISILILILSFPRKLIFLTSPFVRIPIWKIYDSIAMKFTIIEFTVIYSFIFFCYLSFPRKLVLFPKTIIERAIT